MRAALVATLLCGLAVTPSYADPLVENGQPCATHTTGATNNHLGHEAGVLRAGPWVVAGGRDVTITCEMDYGAMDCYDSASYAFRVSSAPRDTVAVFEPRVLEFWNPYQQAIFLGTTITWTNADGSAGVHRVDFDGAKPGDQCAVVTWGNEA